MVVMSLSADLDRSALAVREGGGDPYEVAVSLALLADRLAGVSSSPESGAAAAIRDSFGTWAEHIHSNAGADDDLLRAEAAQRHVRAALDAWDSGDREDLFGFAEQCRSQVEVVETAWFQERGTPLTRSSWIQRLLRRPVT